MTDSTVFQHGARFDIATTLGLDPGRWPEGKLCLDWTERRTHLGGPLGALLTRHLFSLRWIARRSSGRAVRLTDAGRRALQRHFDLPVAAARSRSQDAGRE